MIRRLLPFVLLSACHSFTGTDYSKDSEAYCLAEGHKKDTPAFRRCLGENKRKMESEATAERIKKRRAQSAKKEKAQHGQKLLEWSWPQSGN